jgi:hypothetical protein
VSNVRESWQAVAAAVFEDADRILSRLDELQKSLPGLIALLQTSAAESTRNLQESVASVKTAVQPALVHDLQTKAREVHAAMVASVAHAAGDAAVTALRSELAKFTREVKELRDDAEAVIAAAQGATSGWVYRACGLSACVGGTVAVVMFVVFRAF